MRSNATYNLKRKNYFINFVAKTGEELINKTKKKLKNMPSCMFLSAIANVPVNCQKAARRCIEFCKEAYIVTSHGENNQKQISLVVFLLPYEKNPFILFKRKN